MTVLDRVKIKNVLILSKRWGELREYLFEYLRSDGTRQELQREVYDRGESVAALVVCRSRQTIVMTKQLRMAIAVAGDQSGFVIEVPSGLLDGRQPEEAIRHEILEETGLEVSSLSKVLEIFPNPSVTTEITHLFIAECEIGDTRVLSAGLACEGEDIEIMEFAPHEIMKMIESGTIKDSKTIILFLFATLHNLI